MEIIEIINNINRLYMKKKSAKNCFNNKLSKSLSEKEDKKQIIETIKRFKD